VNLRLNAFLPRTEVEGPGIRAALWVQGCPIQCPGCAVPWTWDEQGGFTVTVDEIATRILASTDIEGVTFLGGEPFMQAKSLAAL
jgi:anaerobic ribonucleoside-triphosphate reductase activating protein